MKTLLFASFVLALSATAVSGQCNFAAYLAEGRALYDRGEYGQALTKFNSAYVCDPQQARTLSAEMEKVFVAMERSRDQERAGRERAEVERALAVDAQRVARAARARTDSLVRQQQQTLEVLQAEERRASVQAEESRALVDRGTQLLADIGQVRLDSVAENLRRQGDWYFSGMPRNYDAALIYYALACFVASDARLDALVSSALLGQRADSLFYAGEIDSASTVYQRLIAGLSAIGQDTGYERRQLERIADMRGNMERHRAFNDYEYGARLVLRGTWWTIPAEMLRSPSLRTLELSGNLALTDGVPSMLARLPQIDTLIVENSTNLAVLTEWSSLRHLSALVLRGSSRLRELRIDQALPRLASLRIEGHPELVTVAGLDQLPNLRELIVSENPVLNALEPRLSFPYLERLVIGGTTALRELDLRHCALENLRHLEIRGMTRLDLLSGSEAYPALERIELAELPALRALVGFAELTRLSDLTIMQTRLRTLETFTYLPALEQLTAVGNPVLTQLPGAGSVESVDRLVLENNSIIDLSANQDFIKKAKKHMFRRNPGSVIKYLEARYGVLYEGESSYYRENKFVKKNFRGPYSVSLSIRFDRLARGGKGSTLFYYPEIMINRYKSTTPYSATNWEATRSYYSFQGVFTQSLRYLPGNESIDFTSIDVGGHMGTGIAFGSTGQAFVSIGWGLYYRVPGTVQVNIGNYVYSQRLDGTVKGSFHVRSGASYYWNRFKVSVEGGFFGPYVSDKKTKAGIYDVSQTFYSANGRDFSTEPVDFPYIIRYDQGTLPSFLTFSIGLGYALD